MYRSFQSYRLFVLLPVLVYCFLLMLFTVVALLLCVTAKSHIYTVSAKRCLYIFASNFVKCWPIFKVLSFSDLAVNV